MKKGISGLELYLLRQELQVLEAARLDKIFMPGYDELFLIFFKKGKHFLRIHPPSFICISESRRKGMESPVPFVNTLRKHLDHARLTKIIQDHFERILEFQFSKQGESFFLYIELFSKGNIILCDSNKVILAIMKSQAWKDRLLKPRETYKAPPPTGSLQDFTVSSLNAALKDMSLGKFLAVKLGFGNLYSDELCLMARLEKDAQKITSAQYSCIQEAVNTLTSRPVAAKLVLPEQEIIPYDLLTFKESEKTAFASFSDAIDRNWQPEAVKDTHKEKLQRIQENQRESIQRLQQEETDSMRAAELLYENYAEISSLLSDIAKAAKDKNVALLRKKLKKCIIDEKNRAVTVDISTVQSSAKE